MLARLGSAIVLAIGLLGLSRWIFGAPLTFGFREIENKLSPAASCLFTILGLVLWRLAHRTPAMARLEGRRWTLTSLAALAIAGVALARLIEKVALGGPRGFTALFQGIPQFVPAPTDMMQGMGFPSAFGLLLSGVSAFFCSRHLHHKWFRAMAGRLGFAAAGLGLVFALGFVYGHPLQYEGRPVALFANAALALAASGITLTALVSRHERWIETRLIRGLRRASVSLERRVADRTADLNESVRALRVETARREKSEASLMHAQKMESIGRLAAGLAHDFNNLLFVIRSSVDLLERQIGFLPAGMDLLRRIREAASSGSVLTERLLNFARPAPPVSLAPTPASTLIDEALALVRPLLGGGIRTHAHAEPDLWPIAADKAQIQQVLVNLFINAKDAMPDGGNLVVRAANHSVTSTLIARPEIIPPGDYVRVEVKDTGSGIRPEDLDRIFEPFYTTKDQGLGTGLGLATSYSIVKHHGGRISVDSHVGSGTRFSLFLPKASSPPPPPPPDTTPSSPTPLPPPSLARRAPDAPPPVAPATPRSSRRLAPAEPLASSVR